MSRMAWWVFQDHKKTSNNNNNNNNNNNKAALDPTIVVDPQEARQKQKGKHRPSSIAPFEHQTAPAMTGDCDSMTSRVKSNKNSSYGPAP